jgi:alpha-1,3-fucosyltransferase
MCFRNYKFYLSFENAMCEDYVTEKLWKVINHTVVPVVLGGANYSKIVPQKSVINALDFESPQKLAEYLQYLDKNATAYAEYFEWKLYFRARIDYGRVFCQVSII